MAGALLLRCGDARDGGAVDRLSVALVQLCLAERDVVLGGGVGAVLFERGLEELERVFVVRAWPSCGGSSRCCARPTAKPSRARSRRSPSWTS
jgi:hypothetical protein